MTISTKADSHLETVKKALDGYREPATTSEDANYLLQAILAATLANMEVANQAAKQATLERQAIRNAATDSARGIYLQMVEMTSMLREANQIALGTYLAVTGQDVPDTLNAEIVGEEVIL